MRSIREARTKYQTRSKKSEGGQSATLFTAPLFDGVELPGLSPQLARMYTHTQERADFVKTALPRFLRLKSVKYGKGFNKMSGPHPFELI